MKGAQAKHRSVLQLEAGLQIGFPLQHPMMGNKSWIGHLEAGNHLGQPLLILHNVLHSRKTTGYRVRQMRYGPGKWYLEGRYFHGTIWTKKFGSQPTGQRNSIVFSNMEDIVSPYPAYNSTLNPHVSQIFYCAPEYRHWRGLRWIRDFAGCRDPASPAHQREARTSTRSSFARYEFCEKCGLTRELAGPGGVRVRDPPRGRIGKGKKILNH